MIKSFFIGIVLMLCATSVVLGQSNLEMPIKKAVNQSTLFGVGSMILTDTYLSPLQYNGLSLSLLHERLNASSLLSGKLLLQQQFFLQGASTDNPINTAKTYYSNNDYHLNGFYPILKTNLFRYLALEGSDLS